jgi:hypothetical protein
MRIVVDKNGKISDAKALSGPTELFPASVEAAKQYQFEPPQNAPVTTELEMKYGYSPAPCPPGKKGEHANVVYAEKLPMKSEHAGQLKIVADINEPMPPYPEEAREAGKEGDLEISITVAPSGEVVGARVTNPVDPANRSGGAGHRAYLEIQGYTRRASGLSNQVSLSDELRLLSGQVMDAKEEQAFGCVTPRL